MAKRAEIKVPVGGVVERFGLEFRAFPVQHTTKKKGRGKRRPCRVEVSFEGKVFALEPAHDGRSSSKFHNIEGVYLRYERTAMVVDRKDPTKNTRVAVISWRMSSETKSRSKKAFKRTDRLNERAAKADFE